MSHILIVKDAAGKELARVKVQAGYTIKEVPEEMQAKQTSAADKDVSAGDAGNGKEKVG
jgi:hypothetical protein